MAKKKKSMVTMTRSELALGWVWLVFEVALLPTLLNLLNSLLPVPLSAPYLNFVYYCVNCGFILGFFHKFLGRSLAAAGNGFWDFLQAAVLGFVGYWVATRGLSGLVELVFPGFANINDQSIAALAGSHYVLMVIGIVLLVPTAEEVLFRGVVFGSIRRRSRLWAYVVSVVLFAFVHISGYLAGGDWLRLVLSFVQYIPAGLFLAWSYEKADSIFAPIVIHTAINAIGIYAMR